MSICKYCNKPIDDNDIWNPDKDGNGYHHSCLCEMEFKSRDKRIYDKGRTDALEQVRAEIEAEKQGYPPSADEYKIINKVLQIIDKYAKGE